MHPPFFLLNMIYFYVLIFSNRQVRGRMVSGSVKIYARNCLQAPAE